MKLPNSKCQRDGCENEFYVPPYKKKQGIGKFCSYDCYWTYKKGKKLSEEHKSKIGVATKKMWEDGIFDAPHIREAYRQQGLSTRGSKRTLEQKQAMSEAKKGKDVSRLHTPEAIEKRRQKLIGRKQTKESNEKRSRALKGRKFTEEHLKNLSIAGQNRTDIKGENSRFWVNGNWSKDYQYPQEFSRGLKRKIRKKFNYICQCCGASVYGSRFGHIHHIDGNKENSIEENLVLVCISCHNSIHGFSDILNEKILSFRSKLFVDN